MAKKCVSGKKMSGKDSAKGLAKMKRSAAKKAAIDKAPLPPNRDMSMKYGTWI